MASIPFGIRTSLVIYHKNITKDCGYEKEMLYYVSTGKQSASKELRFCATSHIALPFRSVRWGRPSHFLNHTLNIRVY